MPELGPKTVAVLRGATGGGEALHLHGPGGSLRWHGYRDQRVWQMERESQALQAGQWFTAADPLPGRPAQYPPGGLGLWSVVSSSGGARTEINVRYHRCHAQDGSSGNPADENRRGLRSQQSLGGDHQLEGALSLLVP